MDIGSNVVMGVLWVRTALYRCVGVAIDIDRWIVAMVPIDPTGYSGIHKTSLGVPRSRGTSSRILRLE